MSTPVPSEPILIESLPIPPEPSALEGVVRDRAILTAQERRWPRRRIITECGQVLVLALSRARGVDPGTILHVGPAWYVVVEAALEPVLVAGPLTSEQRIRLAHEVGGQHSDIGMDGDDLLVPDDPVMMRLLHRLDLPWKRARRAFVPVATGVPHSPPA